MTRQQREALLVLLWLAAIVTVGAAVIGLWPVP